MRQPSGVIPERVEVVSGQHQLRRGLGDVDHVPIPASVHDPLSVPPDQDVRVVVRDSLVDAARAFFPELRPYPLDAGMDHAVAFREDRVIGPGREKQLLIVPVAPLAVPEIKLLDLGDVRSGQLRLTAAVLRRDPAGAGQNTDRREHHEYTTCPHGMPPADTDEVNNGAGIAAPYHSSSHRQPAHRRRAGPACVTKCYRPKWRSKKRTMVAFASCASGRSCW